MKNPVHQRAYEAWKTPVSHIENLRTLLANLDHAIRNKERVSVGGGIFYGDELVSLRLAVVAAISEQPRAV